MPSAPDGARLRGQHLESRGHQQRIAGGRDDEAGQALQRHGVVPDEVAQVGPGSHQDGVDALLARLVLDRGQSGPVVTAVHGVLLRPSESMCSTRRRPGDARLPAWPPRRAPSWSSTPPRCTTASFYALPEKMTAPDGRPHNAVRGFLSTADPAGGRPRAGRHRRLLGQRLAPGMAGRPRARRTRRTGSPTRRGRRRGRRRPSRSRSARRRSRSPGCSTPLGIARWGVDGYEADDVIGSVTAQFDRPTVVVTGDRDLVQLVDARTSVLLTVNGGMEKWPLLDPAGVEERFGVAPGALRRPRGPARRPVGRPARGAGHRRQDGGRPGGRVRIASTASSRPRGSRRPARPMTPRLAAAAAGPRGQPCRARREWRRSCATCRCRRRTCAAARAARPRRAGRAGRASGACSARWTTCGPRCGVRPTTSRPRRRG